MRTFNVRLFAILLVSIGVLTLGLFWLRGYQVRRHADFFLSEARDAKISDPDKAISLYQRYIQVGPKDTPEYSEATSSLGMLQSEHVNLRLASSTLSRALRLNENQPKVRRRLAEVLITLGRYEDAMTHLKNPENPHALLNDSSNAPEDSELWELLGFCQARTDDLQAAKASLTKAIELGPTQLSAYALLAELLRDKLEQPDEADAVVNQMIDHPDNQKNARAYVMRGDYRRKLDDLTGATEDVQRAMVLDPDNRDVLLLAAACALQQKNFDKVRTLAGRGVTLYPDATVFYRTLAEAELAVNNADGALKWLEVASGKDPKNADLVFAIATVNADAGRVKSTLTRVDELRVLGYTPVLVDYLEALAWHQDGQWKKAADQLDRIRTGMSKWPDLQWRAELILGSSLKHLMNPRSQLAAYQRAVSSDPSSVNAGAALAASLAENGQTDAALQEYERIVELPDVPPSIWLELAQQRFRKTLQVDPDNRNWEAVRQALGNADPSNPFVPILAYQILMAEGHLDEAEQALRTAFERAPDQWQLAITLSEHFQQRAGSSLPQNREDDWKQAEQFIDQAKEAGAPLVSELLSRARLSAVRYMVEYSVQNTDTDSAVLDREHARQQLFDRIGTLVEAGDSLDQADGLQFKRGMIAILLSVGGMEQARDLCREIATMDNQDLGILLTWFNLLLADEDAKFVQKKDQLDDILGRIEQIEGQGALWNYANAVSLVAQAKMDENNRLQFLRDASRSLDKAQRIRPDSSPRFFVLAAEIDRLKGDYQSETENLLKAFASGERAPNRIDRAVRLLYSRKKFQEASDVLQLLENQQRPLELLRLDREVSRQLDDFDRAVLMASEAAAHSDDYQDSIWYGRLLELKTRRDPLLNPAQRQLLLDKAEESLRHAVEMDGNVAATWAALIPFLKRTGQAAEFDEAFEQANSRLAADEAILLSAQVNLELEQFELAVADFRKALENDPNNVGLMRQATTVYLKSGLYLDAKYVLQNILNQTDLDENSDDKIWARRLLAPLLASTAETELERDAALALIEKNTEAPQPLADDLRAKAAVLTSIPLRKHRDEAIQILEGLVRSQSNAAPTDRFTLARLYLADGNWSGYKRQMDALLRPRDLGRSDIMYLVTYIRELLRQNEVQAAERSFSRLEVIAPNDFGTHDLGAAVLAAQGKFSESRAKLLSGFVTSETQTPQQKALYVPLAAARLEDLAGLASTQADKAKDQQAKEALLAEQSKFLAAAETKYREYVELSPNNISVLAAFLARRDRLDEAMDLMDSALESKLNASSLILPGATVMRSSQLNSAEFARLEALLRSAAQTEPDNIGLHALIGDLYSWGMKYDKAIKAYTDIVESERSHKRPVRYDVSNNLALLLAVKGDHRGARVWMDDAMQVGGRNATLLDSSAMVYLIAEEPEKARVELQQAIAEEPSGTRFFHLSQALHDLGAKTDKDAGADPRLAAQAQKYKSEAKKAMEQAQKLGLTIEDLHPMEHEAYRNLQDQLMQVAVEGGDPAI